MMLPAHAYDKELFSNAYTIPTMILLNAFAGIWLMPLAYAISKK